MFKIVAAINSQYSIAFLLLLFLEFWQDFIYTIPINHKYILIYSVKSWFGFYYSFWWE